MLHTAHEVGPSATGKWISRFAPPHPADSASRQQYKLPPLGKKWKLRQPAAAMVAFPALSAPPCTSFSPSSVFLTPCSSYGRSTAPGAAAVRGLAATWAQRTLSASWVPSDLAVARPAARKARLEELDTTNMLLRQRIVFLGSPVSSLIRFFRKFQGFCILVLFFFRIVAPDILAVDALLTLAKDQWQSSPILMTRATIRTYISHMVCPNSI